MKYHDTTDPKTYRMMVPLITNQAFASELEKLEQLRFRIIGIYHSLVCSEWGSQGRAETDFFHHIHLACSGSARIIHGKEAFDLKAGQAYWLMGNTPVVRESPERYESYVIKFRCEGRGGADPLFDWRGRRPRNLGKWDRARWEKSWRGNAPTSNAWLALMGQLRIWMAEAFPELDQVIASHYEAFSTFERALNFLEKKLGADLRIAELARIHGTTPHAFSMSFERHLGMSPKAYLNRRLNQEACRLLVNTDGRIKEVAQQLAFTDEFYFSRFFTKMNELSPTRYRALFGATVA